MDRAAFKKVVIRLEAARTALPRLTLRARQTSFADRVLHPEDEVCLEKILHDLTGDLDIVLGRGNNYSQQLNHIFNSERDTIDGLASVKCVQRIGAVADSAITHLRNNLPQPKESSEPILPIQQVCTRLHGFIQQLERSGLVSTPLIRDERSLQHLLNALLRLYFNDIRTEEYSPSYAGGGSRIDFLLKTEQLAIEVKIAHTGNPDKVIGAELLVDQERYRAHPDCKTLLCLIYDPNEFIHNPHGLKNDLERLSDSSLRIIVVISPSR